MPLNLTASHIRLRPLESRDLDALVASYRDMDMQLTTDGDAPPMSEVEARAMWDEIMTNPGAELRYFAIEPLPGNPGEGQLVGACSLQHIDMRNRHAELGIFMASTEWRGQGYGTQAVNLLLDYAFEVVRLDKVHLGVYDFNEAGLRAYERAGFRYEGRLRRMIYYEGRYWDEWPMRILRSEWAQARLAPAEELRPYHPADYVSALAIIQHEMSQPDVESARAVLRRWWRQIDRAVYGYQANGVLVGLLTLSVDVTPPTVYEWVVSDAFRLALEESVARITPEN